MPGRGAYLCREAACWDLAARKRSLEHALKVAIPDAILAALAAGPPAPTTTTEAVHHRAIGADTEPDDHEGGAHGPK